MLEMPQVNPTYRHFFSDGVYAREMSVPAGSVTTGALHKYPQMHIISKGSCSVNIDDEIQTIEAPYTFVAPPGAKRVIYALTDLVWTTILHTYDTDVLSIEDHFTAKSDEDYISFVTQKLL